ncbi:MAG: polysaccharide biosynthesis/export family protein [Bacteroidia bacterium]|nr:polysaccharide biosynthesis/export family protein [Bacteroidia bacterium]
MKHTQRISLTLTAIILLLVTACIPQKNVVYFNANKADSTVTFPEKEVTFKTGDIVIVNVFSPSKETSVYFNYSELHAMVAGVPVNGYLVDFNGNIEMPMIGQISVRGKTTKELQEEVRQKIEKYLINPSVNVRLVNFKITLIGEFKKPGIYTIENNTITLLEAIGLGEDLSIYGKRTITVIRDVNGKKIFTYIDLTNKNQFTNSIHLQNGDVVYAQPIKERKTTVEIFYRVAPFSVALTSVLISLFILFAK